MESCASLLRERLKELTGDFFRLHDTDEVNLLNNRSVARHRSPDLRPSALACPTSSRLESRGRHIKLALFAVGASRKSTAMEILAELGHGGTWAWCKARTSTGLSRFVALKMIRAGSLSEARETWRGLGFEAEAVAQQRHPNIIQIFDIGEVGGLLHGRRARATGLKEVVLDGLSGGHSPSPERRRQ